MKSHLGHYEIVAELGRGGMGIVYKAFDPALDRNVAIKELAPALADDPALVERFLREARAMAALNDPHIIQIHFIGQEQGRPFFVMEFIDGESVGSVLRRQGRLEVADALKIAHQTALGLATAHERGVVHRDIKPGNLMLDRRGRVRIADFGIALPTMDLSRKLTSTGEFIGTPGYVSPEVCTGKPVDRRSDIFSLGIVLFEMLTGRIPFTDESPLGLMLEVVNAQIPDICAMNPQADAQTAAILARMVAKEPADRFQDCRELAAALQAHPLVAAGGPLAVAVVPVHETLVGAAPKRTPTPPPVVSAGGVAAATPLRATTSATVARTPAPATRAHAAHRSRVPWALAAAVLVLAGGAYAFRDYLTGFANGYRDGFVTGKVTNPVGSTQAATAAPASTTANPAASNAVQANDDQAVAPNGATTSNGAAVADTTLAQTTPANAPGVDAANGANASTTTSAPTAGIASASAANSTTADTTAATAPAANAAQTPATASVAPPKRVAPPPPPPRVLVVALGDPALALPAQQQIEGHLADAGHLLADADLVGGDDLPAILRAAARHASVVIVVRAEPIGTRELYYHGHNSTLYSAYLSARAYDVAGQHPLGAGFRKKVDFATLNVELKAREALAPELMGLERAVAPYRRASRG